MPKKKKFRPEPGVSIIVKPRVTVTWAEFKENYPPCSIALDGFVRGPTRYFAGGPHANFNHHEGQVTTPIAVLACCAQIENAIRENDLYSTFCRDGKPFAKTFVRDNDQDVCTATFGMRYPSLLNRPLFHELIDIESKLDSTAGLYVPNRKQARMMGYIASIFAPYTSVRMSGELFRMNSRDMKAVIYEVHDRIKAFLFGRAKRMDLDRRYELIEKSENWAIVREIGPFARMKMVEDGIRAYILLKGVVGDRYHYSVGKKAMFNPLSMPALYKAANQAEGIPEDALNGWGGGTNRGGSPQEDGSIFPPKEVGRIALHTFGP